MKNRQENKESFIKKHFSKKRTTCSKCHNDIDAYLDKCPYCASERSVDVLPKRFLNMSFLSDYKEILFLILGTLGVTLIYMFVEFGLRNFQIRADGLKSALAYLISYIVVIALLICIVSHDTPKIAKQVKKQSISARTWVFIGCGVALIIAFAYGYTYALRACGISIESTVNEKEVEEIVKKWPAIAFFFTVLFAPLIEEFCYRVGLFSVLRKRNRYLAYVVTVIIFAFMHFLPSLIAAPSAIAKDAICIPLYIMPSLVLAITYEYAGLSASLYVHIINNLINFIIVVSLPL